VKSTADNYNSVEHKLKEDDIVYFLHIPKTAGTTLYFILDSHFDLDSIYPRRFWNKLLPSLKSSKHCLFRGHFGYGLHRLLPKKPIYLTMLRDPIERTISDYNDRVRYSDPLFKDKYSKDQTISEFFNDPEKRKTFENIQTLYIALDLDILSLIKSFDSESLNRFRYREYLQNFRDGISDSKLLETAKQRLANFEFIGIAEKFEESMFLLYYTFGWRPIYSVWTLNVAPDSKDRRDLQLNLAAQTKKSSFLKTQTKDYNIKDCNKLDMELYQYGKKIFEQRYSKMVRVLKAKYYENSYGGLSPKEVMYKMLEKHYEKCFTDSQLAAVQSIDYTFDQKLSGSGWYYREVFEETGKTFRWTGPQTVSTIDFPLAKDNNLIIQLSIMRAIAPDIMESLKLKVNDHPVKIKKLYEKDGKAIFEGCIPKSSLVGTRSFTRLSFEINRTVNPHELNPHDPTNRALGIAFERIKITRTSVTRKMTEMNQTNDSSPYNQLAKLNSISEQNQKLITQLSTPYIKRTEN